MSETWRDVPGAPGYKVRVDGAVMGPRGAVLKQNGRTSGYPIVRVSAGSRASAYTAYVHHLVAAAWLGPRPAGCEVDHKDHDRENNRAENLRYLTADENRERSMPGRCSTTGRFA